VAAINPRLKKKADTLVCCLPTMDALYCCLLSMI